MRDIVSNVKTAVVDNGDSVDMQGSDSVMVVGLSDPTARITVSDVSNADFAAPAAADITAITGLGTVAVGYVGTKRYIIAGAADIIVRGNLSQAPAT